MEGWIKLHRKLINKPIWTCSTSEQKCILITLLLMANHDANEWIWKGKKYICQAGQIVTSVSSIADKSGTSTRNVRTALKNFSQVYEFLTIETTNHNSLITIMNWELYQARGAEPTIETTNDRQATDKRPTTNKNDKECKNIRNNKKDILSGKPDIVDDIVNYLNKICSTNYKSTTRKTISLIKARLNEGFLLEDFKTVINKKNAEWRNDDMSRYLRPETLFGTKFEGYLNSKGAENGINSKHYEDTLGGFRERF